MTPSPSRARDLTLPELHARRQVLDAAHAARVGSVQGVCVYCGERVVERDAYDCDDGLLCAECALVPRFDVEECPRCHARWADTIQPCSGCGLTVEECAEVLAR